MAETKIIALFFILATQIQENPARRWQSLPRRRKRMCGFIVWWWARLGLEVLAGMLGAIVFALAGKPIPKVLVTWVRRRLAHWRACLRRRRQGRGMLPERMDRTRRYRNIQMPKEAKWQRPS
jgi:hypothetical protein